MICFPNAKINLGLYVVGKRPDGYHNIETVFYPIPVKDALEIVPSATGNDHFMQTGIPIGGDPASNLVMRLLALLRTKQAIPPLDIHLLKQIPFGAGLGGGSSDAAFMLKLINDFCSLGLSSGEMEEIAAKIGADCPFFIQNRPVFATGTGNIFTPVTISLEGYYFGLVKPPIAVSTPEAYAGVTPRKPERSLTEVITCPVETWREEMTNDFEAHLFHKYPAIAAIKQQLYDNGAIYASMSGSGSSVFGLFRESVRIRPLFPDYYVWEGLLPAPF
ncbi:4-(cytidine 5'-diphospho)-2-C-methyl-D-erythritol kinase [Parabacteroides sp. PFB2-10]|uniref:4-(cytidine 5'-diphospho)-2-C-methyl-D-erythritol kinase n=1 Tax=Parabacteroides sp. PFB2-10 TaxID=1742405 RepID=UPI002474293E|nr:4-(cytidine 5'-diphospho)-2-C-methyl-D-erythritol kinase [Parabacteroides sp. PFB2-10]MDL2244604.1 4-(cytidine 5'-diphospho)-2-C-methyl-D-erythritol kinase [Parabacteroides sp. OttesenSCG-928-J18]